MLQIIQKKYYLEIFFFFHFNDWKIFLLYMFFFNKFEIPFKFLYYQCKCKFFNKKNIDFQEYSFFQLAGVKTRSPLNFSIINACKFFNKKHWFLEIFFLSTVRNQNERLLLSERSSLNYHKTMCKIYILQYRFPSLLRIIKRIFLTKNIIVNASKETLI